MHIPRPKNPEYAAIVVRIPATVALKGRDRIVGVPIYGRQAIVSKDQYEVGELALFFPTEVQLSEAYAHANNLFREAHYNADPLQAGYFELNARVKAIKFAGHRSDALVMPLNSLTGLGLDPTLLREGDVFDHFGGVEICRKYTIPVREGRAPNMQRPKQTRVAARHFPEHVDTANWWRNRDLIGDHEEIIVSQKVHGTSIRVGMVPTRLPKPRTRLARLGHWIAERTGVPIQTYEYAPAYGSRRVIKDAGDPSQNHHYAAVDGVDLWTRHGRLLDGLLPEGFMVYGELIGWNPDGTPIQRGYTYDIPANMAELWVYRVTRINAQGYQTDLSWDQLVEFCHTIGLNPVPVLWRGKAGDFAVDEWMDIRYFDAGHVQAIPMEFGNRDLVDEGVVIRRDGLKPTLLKAKSPAFLRHETGELDAGVADIESVESATELADAA
ncbi:RNA ligase family protein [Nocardia ninae]|uniref:RNA ligase domain-containing protein n=1 Tax=Nocardia ninae NBRC 108245 TaxID=1210091 RepID=A0A511MBI4_9NOCA|nr:RNA ligase family protein [Nocardia ninae]GEM37458.1 hypothetical protein NN4_19770 [Nocardia ninae NBRC 108245]